MPGAILKLKYVNSAPPRRFQYQFDPLTGLCIRFVRGCQPEEYDLGAEEEIGDHYVPPGLHPDRLIEGTINQRISLAAYARPGTSAPSSHCSTPETTNLGINSPINGYAADTPLTQYTSPMFKYSQDDLLFRCDSPPVASFFNMDDIMDINLTKDL